ncbi:MAG: NUDIX hydrolase [Patescibacteria group bacterium]|jgi:8-oxo-dGTP diphosphatase
MEQRFELQQFAEKLKQQAESDGIERILVGAIPIFHKKILLVERSSRDDFLPGYIEIPGGNLKADENILRGVERELFEETNLKVAKIHEYIGSFDAISPDGKKARQFNFLTELTNNHVQLSEEHSRYIWWDIEDLAQIDSMCMIGSMLKILQKAIEHLKKPHSLINE